MKTFLKESVIRPGILSSALALCVLAAPHLAWAVSPTVDYSTTSDTSQAVYSVPTPIPGLASITLPKATAATKHALVTLSLPALYTEASSASLYPGAVVFVTAGGANVAFGEVSQPVNTEDRTPINITVLVTLSATGTETLEGQWESVNAAQLSVGGFGSLSALLVK